MYMHKTGVKTACYIAVQLLGVPSQAPILGVYLSSRPSNVCPQTHQGNSIPGCLNLTIHLWKTWNAAKLDIPALRSQ